MSRPEDQSRTPPAFATVAQQLADVARGFYRRGWALGTSGNFSAVVSRDPFRLAITESGVEKGALSPEQFLQLDESGTVIGGSGRPSAEASVHLAILRARRAGAVLHTHSVWSHILSDRFAEAQGFSIEGYEMLKGLTGIKTHEHSEWVPVLKNSQDYVELSRTVERVLTEHPRAHGFLLRRHGLYTWGEDLAAAKRHVEIFEFLFEVIGRTQGFA
jgi:methylthioribulose-1-phosphate dehydratase